MKSEYKNLKLEDLNSVAKDIVLYLENHSNTSEELSKSFVMYLLGEMGVGKTTFTKSLAKVLGVNDHV
jgi:tRNA A37 threonylcarbamoyladenosine biosynthesis protein TsaE